MCLCYFENTFRKNKTSSHLSARFVPTKVGGDSREREGLMCELCFKATKRVKERESCKKVKQNRSNAMKKEGRSYSLNLLSGEAASIAG